MTLQYDPFNAAGKNSRFTSSKQVAAFVQRFEIVDLLMLSSILRINSQGKNMETGGFSPTATMFDVY